MQDGPIVRVQRLSLRWPCGYGVGVWSRIARGLASMPREAPIVAAVVVAIAGAGAVAVIVTRSPAAPASGPSDPEATSFSLASDETDIDRVASNFPVRITYGACVGEAPPRVSAPRIRTEPDAFIVSYFLVHEHSPGTDVCFGVGLPDRHARLRLPHPLGDKALVSDGGKGNWMIILIPPRGRGAIRALGLRKGFAYSGQSCAAVARYFRDHPKSDWCLY
jgi:hypothetical protein